MMEFVVGMAKIFAGLLYVLFLSMAVVRAVSWVYRRLFPDEQS